MSSEKRRILGIGLVFLLLLGLMLRIHQWHHFQAPDEEQLADMVLKLYDDPFPSGDYIVYPGYPPLWIYLHFFLSLIYQQILLFLGIIRFPSEFLLSGFGRDFLLQSGRLISALAGTILIWLVYRMGSRWFNRTTGVFAALLLAVNGFLIYDAHIFKPDTLLVMMLSASLLCALEYYRRDDLKKLTWASVWFGLAVAAKYNAAVVGVFLALIVFLTCRKQGGRSLCGKALLTMAAGSLLGFAAGAPNWIVHPWTNMTAAYRFITFHLFSFSYYEPRAAYLSYGKLLVQSFGIPLFLVFLAGLYLSIRRRQWLEIILLAYILLYVALLGHSSYFGDRIILPLLPPLALLIAKTVFRDGPGWTQAAFSQRLKTISHRAVLIVLVMVLGGQVRVNIERFNLLHSDSPYQQALSYRLRHFPREYRFGRENLTPSLIGDMGFSDLTRIPLESFRGPDALPFLHSGLFTQHILHNVRQPSVRNALRARLHDYVPFYKISKTPFSGFDADITFWYRKPPYTRTVGSAAKYRNLPSVYVKPQEKTERATLFLPLQLYEKKPYFFRTTNGLSGTIIYSKLPLASLTCHLLLPGDGRYRVRLNNREQLLTIEESREPQYRTIRFSRTASMAFNRDYVYSFAFSSEPSHREAFCIIDPVLEGESPAEPEKPFLQERVDGDVPDLYRSSPPPAWCRWFYRETGIDLVLYQFIQTERIWINERRSVRDRDLEVMALDEGEYSVRITGSRIDENHPAADPFTVTCRLVDEQGMSEKKIQFRGFASTSNMIGSLSVPRKGFVQFRVNDQWKANFNISKLTLEPDLRAYLNSHWAIDGKDERSPSRRQ